MARSVKNDFDYMIKLLLIGDSGMDTGIVCLFTLYDIIKTTCHHLRLFFPHQAWARVVSYCGSPRTPLPPAL
jgi:hypothetical protein